MTLSRELAHRHQDGLEVTLLWAPRSNEITIALIDDRDESAVAFAVEPQSALDAFYHPFAYAPVTDAALGETALAGQTLES